MYVKKKKMKYIYIYILRKLYLQYFHYKLSLLGKNNDVNNEHKLKLVTAWHI